MAPNFWTNTMKLINIYGIASSMSYLHSLNILHNDLKPLNVLIDDFLFPKICDFGLSMKTKGNHIIDLTQKGTPSFIAPEIFVDGIYSQKSDVYAFGMLLYELKTSIYPFETLNFAQIIYKIVNKKERPKIKKGIPKIYKDLIQSCWNQDPHKRPSFESIVNDLRTKKEFIDDDDDVDENIYRSFIELIDQELLGKDITSIANQIFKKYELDSIYAETSDNSFPSKMSINLKFEGIGESEKIYENENSRIYKMKDKKSGKLYSISVSKFQFEYLNGEKKSKLTSEINELLKLKHPVIQQFYGISLSNKKSLSKKSNVIIVNEYFEYKTLEKVIHQNEKDEQWNPTNKLINIYGIASGMQYLHSHHIDNPKLNPKNIIIDSNYEPKLISIGEVTQTIATSFKTKKTSNLIDNTIFYLSPEKLKSNDIDDENKKLMDNEKSDVYSYSLVVYEIISNERPFKVNNNPYEEISKIVDQNYRPTINKSIPKAYHNLIERCWSSDPKIRPSFSEIVFELEMNQKFITNDIDNFKYNKYIQYLKDNQI